MPIPSAHSAALAAPGLGVFTDNRKLPIHRWFPFIEGYSAQLVHHALDQAEDLSSIFDPFGGSGTTPLTAAMRGHDSSFTEANPYMAWVADVKINQSRRAANEPEISNSLFRLAEAPDVFARRSNRDEHPLLAADSARRYFPEGTAKFFVRFLDALSLELEGPALELARLAAAASLVPSSNMLRRTDLRRRRAGEPAPKDPVSTLREKLHMIATDVRDSGLTITGKAHILANDARADYAPQNPFTAIITSPPYLNGTNYGRNTKLELLGLGFLQQERDLELLRVREVTAGINNVSRRLSEPAVISEVEDLADRVGNVTYDQRIPKMIRGYFSDMSVVLQRLSHESAPNAELWLDIGDSRYSGVSVPTHELLAVVADSVGWSKVDELLLRKRRSYDGTTLVQTLLKFRKAN